MALFQLSDDLVRNWSSLGVEEHIPLNETMLTFALKLSIVSLFGSNEVTGEDIKEIRTEYLIVSAFSVRFALKNISEIYMHQERFGKYLFDRF